MCLAHGIPEVFGLASRIGYELRGWPVEFLRHSAMWGLASRIGYGAICGSRVGFLGHLTMWAVSRSAMELCGRQLTFHEVFGYEGWHFRSGRLLRGWRVVFMRHSAMWAGK